MDQKLPMESDAGPQLAPWIVWAVVPERSGPFALQVRNESQTEEPRMYGVDREITDHTPRPFSPSGLSTDRHYRRTQSPGYILSADLHALHIPIMRMTTVGDRGFLA